MAYLEKRGGHNRYIINKDFFKTKSKEMFYVLGFLFADGYIIKSENKARTNYFGFTSKDIDIVEKIRLVLGSNHPIKIITPREKIIRNKKYFISEQFLFRVGSREMVEDLEKMGLIPRKSLCVEFPNIEKKYLGHFIRGYFDGDGCVSIKNKRLKIIFSSGSKIFLEKLSNLFSSMLSVDYKKVYTSHHCFQLVYSTKDSWKIFDFIYKDSNQLFLCRKYNKFVGFYNNQA